MELSKLLEAVDGAGERELNAIVLRMLKRYGDLFPEEEILFLSLPLKDQRERRRILDDFYQRMVSRAE